MLLKEFQEAQRDQMNALIARERASAKKLKIDQSVDQKEFDAREREARQKYFADERPGVEKRAYMKDLLARRDQFRKLQADRRNQLKTESSLRIQALTDEQAENLLKFKDQLAKGIRPSDKLWPQPTL